MNRRDQEITETTIETRDEGVRFFIQVRYFIGGARGRRRAGQEVLLIYTHIDTNLVGGRRMGGRDASK